MKEESKTPYISQPKGPSPNGTDIRKKIDKLRKLFLTRSSFKFKQSQPQEIEKEGLALEEERTEAEAQPLWSSGYFDFG